MPIRFAGLGLSLILIVVLSTAPRLGRTAKERSMVPRQEVVLAFFKSHPTFAADYFWIQVLQKIGGALYPEEYLDCYPYADLATDIDPKFFVVYKFAGITIPTNTGRSTWVNYEESTKIIRKGLKEFTDSADPKHYQLSFLEAYNLMFFYHDYRHAADILVKLAKVPGSPSYLGKLATRLYAQAGDYQTGLEMADEMRKNSSPDEQAFYEQRMKEIQLEEILKKIDADLKVFEQNNGRQALNIFELYPNGVPYPPDPLGGVYEVDRASGRAGSSKIRIRLELLEEEHNNHMQHDNL